MGHSLTVKDLCLACSCPGLQLAGLGLWAERITTNTLTVYVQSFSHWAEGCLEPFSDSECSLPDFAVLGKSRRNLIAGPRCSRRAVEGAEFWDTG